MDPRDANVSGDPGHFSQTKSRREIKEQKKEKKAQRNIDDNKRPALKLVDCYTTERGSSS